MLKSLCLTLGMALGVGSAANGLYMLAKPEPWYYAIPGVTMTGPFNQHFVRDIGLIYLLTGAALITGTLRPQVRVALWGVPTLWLAGHALFHFWEVAVGICSADAIPRDFLGVTLPAILTGALTAWAARTARANRRSTL